MSVPDEEWIGIEIHAPLGESAGHWDLIVKCPGKDPQRFEKLPCQNPMWKTLDWLGFVSQADTESEIWIDDLELLNYK